MFQVILAQLVLDFGKSDRWADHFIDRWILEVETVHLKLCVVCFKIYLLCL